LRNGGCLAGPPPGGESGEAQARDLNVRVLGCSAGQLVAGWPAGRSSSGRSRAAVEAGVCYQYQPLQAAGHQPVDERETE
jgi:hypothetical protein